MDIWLQFGLLFVISFAIVIKDIIKDKKVADKFFKTYRKVEGTCSEIKYIREEREDVEGSYEVFAHKYILNYSVDGVEYQTKRLEEVPDGYGHYRLIDRNDNVDIWVNPDNLEETFIPKFDDNRARGISSLVVLISLSIICVFIIQNSV